MEERERPVADEDHVLAVGVSDEPDGAVAQARIEVAGEAVARLVVVVVGVHEAVVELHPAPPPEGRPPSSAPPYCLTSFLAVPVKVLNMMRDLGEGAVRSVADNVGEEVEVVAVPPAEEFAAALADGLEGEVLLASWLGHPVFDHLDALGVRWMHVPATGVDAWPKELLERSDRHVRPGRERDPDLRVRHGRDARLREAACPTSGSTSRPSTGTSRSAASSCGKTLGPRRARRDRDGRRPPRARVRHAGPRAAPHARPASPIAGVELGARPRRSARDADHLVLAAPATPATRHLLDAGAFARVKPGVHLVNIARGTLVDQDALRVALDDGRVAMATPRHRRPRAAARRATGCTTHPKVRLTAHVSW